MDVEASLGVVFVHVPKYRKGRQPAVAGATTTLGACRSPGANGQRPS